MRQRRRTAQDADGYRQKEAYAARREAIFAHDRELPYRKSHENPAIKKVYEEFLEEPNSHIAHHLLHTTYCIK